MGSPTDFIKMLYCPAKKIAQRTGMSLELILAQAAQETGWGERKTKAAFNYFNIKSAGGWTGETVTVTVWEDDPIKGRYSTQAKFRVYGSIEEALQDRYDFLKRNKNYAKAGLFDEGVKGNFEKEAQALQDARYATHMENGHYVYAEKLINVYRGPTMRRALKDAEKQPCDCTGLLVDAIDSLKQPYVGAKITISYQPVTGSKITKSFTADEHGKIPSFDAPADSVLTLTINGKPISKTVTLVAGKTKALTLIDPTPQPIKAKTAVHDGAPKTKEKPKAEKKAPTNNANGSKIVTFDIELIDADTKSPLPKTNYFLEYKGHQKAHHTDGSGMEKSIDADAGETINVYVDGYNGQHQKIACFTVKEGVGKMVVKIPSHTFDIILRDEAAPLANYAFETHYRGKVKDRATNSAGKVTITALVGQKIRLKTKDGEKIISFVVDQTKQVYSCLVNSESMIPAINEKPTAVPEQSKAEEPKVVKEQPKAPKPVAKDVSPKQSVIDERSEKGNPLSTVSTSKSSDNYLFPLKVKIKPKSYLAGAGRFGSNRSGGKRKHAGCDLYAPSGTEVRAMADGVVRTVSFFYENTDQIEIVHNDHIIRYGEVLINKSLVKTGNSVKRGQVIGYVGDLSIKVPSNMLHLEMYSNVNDKGTLSGGGKYKRRADLIDPSKFLNESEI